MYMTNPDAMRTPPTFPWHTPQESWQFPIRIPATKGDRNGPSTLTRGGIVSTVTEDDIRVNRYIARANWLMPNEETRCRGTDRLLCEFEPDGQTLFALDTVDWKDLPDLRVPRFIQSEEWPMCCGRSMHFVGQIDDGTICDLPPPEANYWWHDAASFYVFTCCLCLECKAIGQQY